MQLYELSDSELTIQRVQSMLPKTKKGIRRAIPLVQEMVGIIRDRSDRAENRAAVVLGASGVLSGLIVGFSSYLKDPNINGWVVIIGFFSASIILILKTVMFGLKSLDAFKGYELSPEASIELSGMKENDAERKELVFRVWEYYHLLRVCNSRLYYSQKSMMNFTFSIFTLVFAALCKLILPLIIVNHSSGWQIVISLFLILIAIVADYIIERIKKFWKRLE